MEKGFEINWPRMRPVVHKLLHQESVSKKEWHDLFGDVHMVCLWDDKGCFKIHQALKHDILDFILGVQCTVLSHQDEYSLLRAYVEAWEKFYQQCNYVPMPFCQLDQANNKKKSNVKNNQNQDNVIRNMMLDLWNSSIFSSIQGKLQDSAMKLLWAERLGDTFDSQLVIGVRESYVNLCSDPNDRLKIYRQCFEKHYLKETEDYYRTRAQAYLYENGVLEYMKWASLKLKEEEARARRYLETNAQSIRSISDCCIKILVANFREVILNECPALIEKNMTDELKLMFKLMDKLKESGVEKMLEYLGQHICAKGLEDMMAAADTITQDSEKYVEQLLRLFHKFSQLVWLAFEDDPRATTVRDQAFKTVVNDTRIFKLELPTKSRNQTLNILQQQQLSKGVGAFVGAAGNNSNEIASPLQQLQQQSLAISMNNAHPMKCLPESRCPELLANYCDMLLRRTALSRKLTTDEIDVKLKDVLLVLKYVQNKDVFMRVHKAHLTRRLILNASADSEKEENMVECLRELGMPADHINKLARMFQDIKVSEDLHQQFKNSLRQPAAQQQPIITVSSVKSQQQQQQSPSASSGGDMSHSVNNTSSMSPATAATNSERMAKNLDAINIKILNAGAWSRGGERIPVTLPREMEEIVPEIEEFYKTKHSGRKLIWYHHMSNGTLTFTTNSGKFDLDVTAFQMAVLFAWNERSNDKISFEDLRLATELPISELKKTLWVSHVHHQ